MRCSVGRHAHGACLTAGGAAGHVSGRCRWAQLPCAAGLWRPQTSAAQPAAPAGAVRTGRCQDCNRLTLLHAHTKHTAVLGARGPAAVLSAPGEEYIDRPMWSIIPVQCSTQYQPGACCRLRAADQRRHTQPEALRDCVLHRVLHRCHRACFSGLDLSATSFCPGWQQHIRPAPSCCLAINSAFSRAYVCSSSL